MPGENQFYSVGATCFHSMCGIFSQKLLHIFQTYNINQKLTAVFGLIESISGNIHDCSYGKYFCAKDTTLFIMQFFLLLIFAATFIGR